VKALNYQKKSRVQVPRVQVPKASRESHPGHDVRKILNYLGNMAEPLFLGTSPEKFPGILLKMLHPCTIVKV
jgi:hypothetical protein